jgi:LmbE family N-acetylglucosaminyl deacetylase
MALELLHTTASVYVPDGAEVAAALARTTHLVVGAHADDVEFMAWAPILDCRTSAEAWLTAVVVGDGRGSPRSGPYADVDDETMRRKRLDEQYAAARLGGYSAVICLDFASSLIRSPQEPTLRAQLAAVLRACCATEIYTHSPTDRHDTHVGVCLALVDALRTVEASGKPQRLLGCEVWGSLDWLTDDDKWVVDVSRGLDDMAPLMGVYASQIAGGKRYDMATTGRKRANATYLRSHQVDTAQACEYFVDMSELLRDESLSVRSLAQQWLRRFAHEIDTRLERLS